MNQHEAPFNPFPEDRFLYLPGSNIMLNLEMIGMIAFAGEAGSPSCVVHMGGNVPELSLHGRDIERLATALRIDFQAVQTGLQQAHAIGKKTSPDS